MRAFMTFVLGLLVVAILGGIGVGVYNAGVSAGLAQSGGAGAGAAAAAAPYIHGWGVPFFGFGFGFGLLGLLFPLLFLFLIFGLIRAAFGGRRGWGHHGWDGGPAGWRSDREQYMADLHRRFHEADAGTLGGRPSSTAPGASTSSSGSNAGAPGGPSSGAS